MKKIDRIREKISILPTATYLSKMHDAGWKLVALEWEREVEVSGEPPEPRKLGRRFRLDCGSRPIAGTWKRIRWKCRRCGS